jgi:glycosyltransferase involved in cell wall biosynthesis
MQSLVSILIPCYNAERWIAQAIESALAQTWIAKEVIVVDDGSADRSLEVIRSFGNRIRSETGTHQGGNAARNHLLEMAQGEWVQYIDADDYLLPDKITDQMVFLASHADADVVFSPVTLERWSARGCPCELLPIPKPHDPWVLLARWWLPQTGASLWRKRAISDVGGWKLDQLCCQEHELYLRLLIGNKRFVYCPRNGAIYRQWSGGTVCTHDIKEVHRRRLEIKHRAENHLAKTSQLTSERLRALNQARFEIARTVWHYDPDFAGEIIAQIRSLEPQFIPEGRAAPARYRFVYRCFGFKAAENVAAVTRHYLRPLLARLTWTHWHGCRT